MAAYDYSIVGAGSAGCVRFPANTNGPVMAMAWRAASLIREDWKAI
jgi:choline dehydrogenase-like flavoprotein